MKKSKSAAEIGKVVICDSDHPHANEVGELTGRVISLFGQPMAEIKLDSCTHGEESCFVSAGQIRKLYHTQPERTTHE